MKKIAFVAVLFASLCAVWLIGTHSNGAQAVVSRVLVRKAADLFHGHSRLDSLMGRASNGRHALDSEVPL
jgi:hypothetical protein